MWLSGGPENEILLSGAESDRVTRRDENTC